MAGMTAGQIVRLREKLGMSVPEFARFLGVDHTAVYRWESGQSRVRVKSVRAQLLDLWDKAFGAPWDRETARFQLSRRMGVSGDQAGQLLIEYGRAPGESWRDVVGRVVDGERSRVGRRARA